jgi:hypothetical protein
VRLAVNVILLDLAGKLPSPAQSEPPPLPCREPPANAQFGQQRFGRVSALALSNRVLEQNARIDRIQSRLFIRHRISRRLQLPRADPH